MATVREAGARPGLALLATGLGLFMVFLDATIVNVALPEIQREFSVGEAGIQWVVAAYSLTMGMFMMTSASLADSRGRRRAYIAGLVIFAVGSVACAAAPSILILSCARGLQGVGAATVNVASLALVGAAYPDPGAKAKAIGAWTGIAAVGLAIGPTVGGFLTEEIGWRAIFLVNPIVAGVAIVVTLAVVSESRDPRRRQLDLAGQLLFIVGVGAVTYALVEGPHDGWTSPLIVGLLVASAVLTAVFIRVELRSADPMMDVRVFGDRVYTAAIVTIFAVLFAVYGTMLLITQYLQNVRGYSPEEAGLLMISMTVPTIIAAPLIGRLSARLGPRRPTLVAVGCVLAGTAALALTTGGWVGFTAVALAGVGVGGGGVAGVTGIAMTTVSEDRAGMASGILSVQRALGSTAGFAIMGTILAATVSLTLRSDLEPLISDAATRDEAVESISDDANPRAMAALIGPGRPLPDDVAKDDELYAAADGAFTDGIRAAEALAFLVVLGAFVFGFRTFPRTEQVAAAEEEAEADRLEGETP
jgi:EmrB/QacA subfamily drug resistance transporter